MGSLVLLLMILFSTAVSTWTVCRYLKDRRDNPQ